MLTLSLPTLLFFFTGEKKKCIPRHEFLSFSDAPTEKKNENISKSHTTPAKAVNFVCMRCVNSSIKFN
eukprot:m.309561 g.309561  ORF g.309561 m.309561 type:complete len:68 (-) comp23034_c11_seq8:893-1096(-)